MHNEACLFSFVTISSVMFLTRAIMMDHPLLTWFGGYILHTHIPKNMNTLKCFRFFYFSFVCVCVYSGAGGMILIQLQYRLITCLGKKQRLITAAYQYMSLFQAGLIYPLIYCYFEPWLVFMPIANAIMLEKHCLHGLFSYSWLISPASIRMLQMEQLLL